jgi:large subunit ribosomal protein L4
MKAAALRGALSDRARGGRVHVLSAFLTDDRPSTKSALAGLSALGLERNVLVVCQAADHVTWKSLRNVPSVHLITPGQLNTYDVLVSDDVVFTEAALGEFLAGPPKGKSAKAVATSTEAEAVVSETPSGTPATGAGETKPAGAGESTEDLVEEVAEQTDKNLLVEPVNEELSEAAEGKTSADPADEDSK